MVEYQLETLRMNGSIPSLSTTIDISNLITVKSLFEIKLAIICQKIVVSYDLIVTVEQALIKKYCKTRSAVV